MVVELPPQAPLQSEPLPYGTVLCLDIDGVCAPLGRNPRFNPHGPPPGFVARPPRLDVPFHPDVPKWLGELARAFDHVVWISSWGRSSAEFVEHAGVDFAARWPSMELHVEGVTTPLPWIKLEPVRSLIAPDQAVAVVDDDLTRRPEGLWAKRHGERLDATVERLRTRPGPLLMMAPAREVGLSRASVDLLCEFARNPGGRQFEDREVRCPQRDWWEQWPWPLDGHENPVRIEVENEREWRAARHKAISERYRELRETPGSGVGRSR